MRDERCLCTQNRAARREEPRRDSRAGLCLRGIKRRALDSAKRGTMEGSRIGQQRGSVREKLKIVYRGNRYPPNPPVKASVSPHNPAPGVSFFAVRALLSPPKDSEDSCFCIADFRPF